MVIDSAFKIRSEFCAMKCLPSCKRLSVVEQLWTRNPPRDRSGTPYAGDSEGVERGLDRSPPRDSAPVPKESSIMRRIRTGLVILSAAGMLGAVALAETKVEVGNVHLCCPACVKGVASALEGRRRGHGRLQPEGQDCDHHGSR